MTSNNFLTGASASKTLLYSSIDSKRKAALRFENPDVDFKSKNIIVINSPSKIIILKDINETKTHYQKTHDYLCNDFDAKYINNFIRLNYKFIRRKSVTKCVKISENKFFVFYYLVYSSDISNFENTSYIFYWEEIEIE